MAVLFGLIVRIVRIELFAARCLGCGIIITTVAVFSYKFHRKLFVGLPWPPYINPSQYLNRSLVSWSAHHRRLATNHDVLENGPTPHAVDYRQLSLPPPNHRYPDIMTKIILFRP